MSNLNQKMLSTRGNLLTLRIINDFENVNKDENLNNIFGVIGSLEKSKKDKLAIIENALFCLYTKHAKNHQTLSRLKNIEKEYKKYNSIVLTEKMKGYALVACFIVAIPTALLISIQLLSTLQISNPYINFFICFCIFSTTLDIALNIYQFYVHSAVFVINFFKNEFSLWKLKSHAKSDVIEHEKESADIELESDNEERESNGVNKKLSEDSEYELSTVINNPMSIPSDSQKVLI